jgi:cyclic pyranopterin phosphate synthase
MVDVGAKPVTARWARAEGVVHVGRVIAVALRKTGGIAKGNVLETARLAGIQAAKQTAALIPLCHPVSIDIVELDARVVADEVRIEARVTCEAKTGVEMEALTAVAVAALTVYDMCKAADKGIEIGSIRLVEKGGGKSGLWTRKSPKQERCKSGTGILPVIPSVVSHVMFIDRGQDARAARG